MICIAYGELKQKIDTSSKWQGSRWPCRSYVLPESWEIVKFWSRALSCDQQWPADFTHNRSWVVFFLNYVHLCLSVSIIFYLFLSIYLYLLVSVSLSISLYFNIYGQGKMQRKSPSLSHKPPNTEVAPKVHRDPLRLLDLDPRLKSCHGCAKPAQAEIQRGGSAYLAW